MDLPVCQRKQRLQSMNSRDSRETLGLIIKEFLIPRGHVYPNMDHTSFKSMLQPPQRSLTPASMVGVSTSNHRRQPRLKYNVVIFSYYSKLRCKDTENKKKMKRGSV